MNKSNLLNDIVIHLTSKNVSQVKLQDISNVLDIKYPKPKKKDIKRNQKFNIGLFQSSSSYDNEQLQEDDFSIKHLGISGKVREFNKPISMDKFVTTGWRSGFNVPQDIVKYPTEYSKLPKKFQNNNFFRNDDSFKTNMQYQLFQDEIGIGISLGNEFVGSVLTQIHNDKYNTLELDFVQVNKPFMGKGFSKVILQIFIVYLKDKMKLGSSWGASKRIKINHQGSHAGILKTESLLLSEQGYISDKLYNARIKQGKSWEDIHKQFYDQGIYFDFTKNKKKVKSFR